MEMRAGEGRGRGILRRPLIIAREETEAADRHRWPPADAAAFTPMECR